MNPIGMSSADDDKMSDTHVPETLETIAARIEALSKSTSERFATIDQRFATMDQQVVETRAQLGVKIDAVDAKVVKVYDEVIAMRDETKRNAREHKTFTKRLDNHDIPASGAREARPRQALAGNSLTSPALLNRSEVP